MCAHDFKCTGTANFLDAACENFDNGTAFQDRWAVETGLVNYRCTYPTVKVFDNIHWLGLNVNFCKANGFTIQFSL